MPLRPVQETVTARVKEDKELQKLMLLSFLESLLNDEMVEARLTLRDLVNGTIGFMALGEKLKKDPKSLMRMLSLKGNPSNENLFAIFNEVRHFVGINIEFSAHAHEHVA